VIKYPLSGKKKYKVLVCPLDWGLGHATRCVPIIKMLLQAGHEVIIGADNKPYQFLKSYFPQLAFIRFPGIEISYPINSRMTLKMLRLLPSIIRGVRREHQILESFLDRNQVDLIISDNRPGLWSSRTHSVYITHQILIKSSWKSSLPEKLMYRIHRRYIEKFDHCWIPDLKGPTNLSGDLSHKLPSPSNSVFIGPLSRFFNPDNSKAPDSRASRTYDIVALVSGPEPQRSVFEDLLKRQLKDLPYSSVLLRGVPGKGFPVKEDGKPDVYDHLNDREMRHLIKNARYVICRSGYSTIMDLAALNTTAILVPTPGQTEQEYLARNLSEKGYFVYSDQKDLSLQEMISSFPRAPVLPDIFTLNLLQTEIDRIIS